MNFVEEQKTNTHLIAPFLIAIITARQIPSRCQKFFQRFRQLSASNVNGDNFHIFINEVRRKRKNNNSICLIITTRLREDTFPLEFKIELKIIYLTFCSSASTGITTCCGSICPAVTISHHNVSFKADQLLHSHNTNIPE